MSRFNTMQRLDAELLSYLPTDTRELGVPVIGDAIQIGEFGPCERSRIYVTTLPDAQTRIGRLDRKGLQVQIVEDSADFGSVTRKDVFAESIDELRIEPASDQDGTMFWEARTGAGDLVVPDIARLQLFITIVGEFSLNKMGVQV